MRIQILLLLAFVTLGCEKRAPEEVGGTCDSIGGQPCDCSDGTKGCTTSNEECDCPGGPESPFPEPTGGDCSSLGGEPCECADGTMDCTDHTGKCLCPGGAADDVVPHDLPEEPDPSKPPGVEGD